MTSTKDLIKSIIEILKEEKVITISDLADKIGSNWSTTKHNVELLETCEFIHYNRLTRMNTNFTLKNSIIDYILVKFW